MACSRNPLSWKPLFVSQGTRIHVIDLVIPHNSVLSPEGSTISLTEQLWGQLIKSNLGPFSVYGWTRSCPMRDDVRYVTSSLFGWEFVLRKIESGPCCRWAHLMYDVIQTQSLLQKAFRWIDYVYNMCGGLFYWHGLTLIPACKSNYTHYQVWDELLSHSQTSTVEPLKFGNG